ncbi:hypothetical protein ARMSODRAFT_1069211 [Armillaria solidipes]|uniref:Uncharacterized protein n=1 Tax=Armillaria solidipes TaxID=1076256 RepID=A0A2H3AMP3_9AGAR|nr:hypothetical protein ARMSODRAFT_1069211 [Armillaria solidipes]
MYEKTFAQTSSEAASSTFPQFSSTSCTHTQQKPNFRMESPKDIVEQNDQSHPAVICSPSGPLPASLSNELPPLPPSPSAGPAPPSVDTNKLPDVPENKKGWIKGAALEFLEQNHLPHFIELYEDSPAQVKEYTDMAYNNLHVHFDFHLPMNVLSEKPYDPKEPLSPADQLLKMVVIAQDHMSVLNWLRKEMIKVCGSKKVKLVMVKDGVDTMDILLGHMNGIEPGVLKETAPYQLWVKEEGEQECLLFREVFKNLGEETQDLYKTQIMEDKVKAQEDHDCMRVLIENPLLPQEAQNLIDHFGALMTLSLDQVVTLSGMKVLLIMGSSEPQRGGKLNMLVQNHGKDKSAIPIKFSGNATGYDCCLEAFREFLMKCYDKDDELAWALPGAEEEETMDTVESSRSVPHIEVDILQGLLRLEEEHFLDEDKTETAPAPKKKGRWAPKRSKEISGESSQRGKKKRADDNKVPMKKKVKTSDSGQANFMESSAGSRGKKKKDVALKKVVASIGAALAKVPGLSCPLGQPSPLPPLHPPPPPQPESPQSCIPIFGPNDMPNLFEGTSVMLPVQQQKPTLSPEDATYLKEGIGPDWFKKARHSLNLLLLSSLGDAWDDMMWFWRIIEGHQGGWPLAKVRLGRKDLKALGDAWWAWWKALQPDWKGVSAVERCLKADHQVSNSEWGCLWHPGVNGLMTVLICLKWWGELITKHYGIGSIWMRSWEVVVDDILWVMSSMVT